MSTRILDAIKKRRTCFEFSNKKVSKANLTKIIDAGRFAPSSHNCQDWKFIVIENKKTIQRVMADCTYGIYHTDPPLLIAIVAEPIYQQKKGLLSAKLLDKAQYHKYLNIGFAADHMLLTAYDLNISTALLSPTIAVANKILDVPSNCETILCIAVGYPQKGAFHAKKERKEFDDVVRYESYQHKKGKR